MTASREHVDGAKPQVDRRVKQQSHPLPDHAREEVFRGDPSVGISPESSPAQLLYLQRMVGNRAVVSLLGSHPTTMQRKPPSLSGLKKTFGLGKKSKKNVAGTAGPGAQGVLPKSLVGSPPNAAAAKTQVAGILSFAGLGDTAGSTSRLSSKTVAALADEADEAGSGEEGPAPTALSTGSGSSSSSSESLDTSSEDASIASWTESEADDPQAPLMFSRDKAYRDEFYKGTSDLWKFLNSAEDATRQGTVRSVDEWMMNFAGWSKADCDKYVGKDAPTPMVTSLSTASRAAYEIKGGGSMTQGDSEEPFDTSNMFSKVKGRGFGIYVMDGQGRMYAGHHKVGIFHQSSFLAGGDVAAAGELKVVGGVLKAITNKSGHYKPDVWGLHHVLDALQNRGVDMSSVELFVFGPYDENPPPFFGGVPRFVIDPSAPATAPSVVPTLLDTSDRRKAPKPRYPVSQSESSSSSEESRYKPAATLDTLIAAHDAGSDSSSSSEESRYKPAATLDTLIAAHDAGSDSSSSSEESRYKPAATLDTLIAAHDAGSDSSSSSEESRYKPAATLDTLIAAHDAGSDSSSSSEEGQTSGSTSAPPVAVVPPVAVAPPVPLGPKYAKTRSRDIRYRDEFTRGNPELKSLIEKTQDAKKAGQTKSVSATFQKDMGWTEEETHKYLRKGAPLPMVTKLGARGRAALELKGGSPMTQGDSKEPYDTSSLASNFMGRGYAIFVMDGDGHFYASQHKVGIFHHSSFLAGGDVTGAGEIRIERGAVKAITNKSGHYVPSSEEMVQVFEELEARGVDLAAVEYIPMGTPDAFGLRDKDPYRGGAKKFLADQRAGAMSGA